MTSPTISAADSDARLAASVTPTAVARNDSDRAIRPIEWEFQPYSAWVARCGYCAAQYALDTLVHTMDEASHLMREIGWHATRAGDVYRHVCPDCWNEGRR